jgi:sugar phosphate isomerase/epimerase
MNLYVSTTFFQDGTDLGEALDSCAYYGITSVELGSNHSFNPNSLQTINNYSFSYLVHNYFPIPSDPFVLNIASTDESIREKSLQHIYQAIDFCVDSGALLYTFHPGFITDPKGANQTQLNYDFQWDDDATKEYSVAFDHMLRSIEKSVLYSRKRGIQIAIETEGSFYKKDHLLMQRPDEYKQFIKYFDPEDIGINLNIGHLRLSMEAFGFSWHELINIISDRIVAMELSHNNGLQDQHLPLQSNGWYWDLLLDQRFDSAFKILEFRNTSILEVKQNLELFKIKHNGL